MNLASFGKYKIYIYMHIHIVLAFLGDLPTLYLAIKTVLVKHRFYFELKSHCAYKAKTQHSLNSSIRRVDICFFLKNFPCISNHQPDAILIIKLVLNYKLNICILEINVKCYTSPQILEKLKAKSPMVQEEISISWQK